MASPDVWRGLGKEFDGLAKRAHELPVGRSPEPTLRAVCSYGNGQPETGYIRIEGGLVPRLKTEFEEIATRAGRLLNCPSALPPSKFWIHSLCLDCFESGNHDGIIGPPECRIVQGLIEKSALYCLRLAIAADEQEAHRAGISTATTSSQSVGTPVVYQELNLSDDQQKPDADAFSGTRKESLRLRGSLRCDPLFWQYFDYEKTSKTSPYRELLVRSFVSLSIPARRTHRDVAEQVANAASIPIESLPDDLNQPVFPRGQAVFAFAGDQFDQIAQNYENMRWWVSDHGLNMAVVNPANPLPVPTFDELVSELTFDVSGSDEQGHAKPELPGASKQVEGARVIIDKPRGRPANKKRRDAIRCSLNKYGERWREHLPEIFAELDSEEVDLGSFGRRKIDVGDGKATTVTSWAELDLAEGEKRDQIIDTLRKYFD